MSVSSRFAPLISSAAPVRGAPLPAAMGAFARVLRLLACVSLAAVLAACASTSGPAPAGFYRVESGDTLYSIARRNDRSVAELVRWNKLSSANRIEKGQLLRVQPPGGASASGGGSARSGSKSTQTVSAPRPASRAQSGPVSGISLMWPAQGKLISTYGGSSTGLTIANSAGTPVVAAAAGTVAYAANGLRGYGNMVIVRHGNGTFLTIYAHNRKLLVRQGQSVKQGQTIAEMGDSDRKSPALYFELRRDGKAVNPLGVMPKR